MLGGTGKAAHHNGMVFCIAIDIFTPPSSAKEKGQCCGPWCVISAYPFFYRSLADAQVFSDVACIEATVINK